MNAMTKMKVRDDTFMFSCLVSNNAHGDKELFQYAAQRPGIEVNFLLNPAELYNEASECAQQICFEKRLYKECNGYMLSFINKTIHLLYLVFNKSGL